MGDGGPFDGSYIPFLECIREGCQNAKILVEV